MNPSVMKDIEYLKNIFSKRLEVPKESMAVTVNKHLRTITLFSNESKKIGNFRLTIQMGE